MKLNTYEIELILRIYPSIKKSEDQFTIMEISFREFIICSVEEWLEHLYDDEKEIIILKYFKNYKLDHIAGYLGYKNHSSLLKKCNSILEKIRYEFYT